MGDLGFAGAFAEAVSRRAVSLAWLHQRLVERGHPVSPAALSYWRSGRSQPERGTSRDALVEIERLLRVAPGTLVSRLGPSRRPGPRPAERTLRELFAEHPGIEQALEDLGFEGLYDELVEQVRHLSVDVGADGRVREYRVRAVMQARRDGARRTPLILTTDGRGRVPRFVPVAGCTIGRVTTDHATRVYATELVLDRPLAKGELHPYELTIELADAADETWLDHYAARRLNELLVWVRFDPGHVPGHVERYAILGDEEETEKLDLGGGSSAHALARGFGPGILGIRWEW
ncbi:MAG TPA: hypothetical protein VGK78_01745 [Nocardioides sp.]|uniref:hypothetical protein n=1 Tax=Nocardioides sp. TaxID=35761 RepID=UPI002F3F60DA